MLSVFAPRMATLVLFSTAALARRTGALPRWLIVVTYIVGVAEFVNVTISAPTVYVFPARIAGRPGPTRWWACPGADSGRYAWRR